ncbi:MULTISPECIES: HAD family hydrolase [unclassified Breznakia]|uniref:HAD family hydrolase n=1 Tax=unclassified Breznakia TaxID=2623764 RepID=UPI0024741B04|nr:MULTISPECIES: HAD family hydrolase [unclassified Breznakia]MDH6368085.1 2-hydroxy-3-keto-5-methylthiopentenyl-1-phosphate phosphatase [Breznakia sp. PH1-1]MDH6405183.1 2-hydroxy-3-keto-5-methylthiopentenyl-1-phosphate phosphatase [Breznakia sp. PF1-11]MDH6412888.1 2-hydroxy-3-keto-5-methylthiopentenyl-1-phosphate phosphatase [Breznakia sp. PFB1-11]MDH6415259.1 2-hydroxy-3-keto-5-methylthiopentenyl-1-phosphate phosphatase [Breznakia sp. PFB1-14]MDH6417559.1 2-hydroxy-3-keto-5-methylthiopente
MKKPVVAFMYDFDKTLCTKDMQEYSFIPGLGMDAATFWQEVTKIAEEEGMDRIISYMYYMIHAAKAKRMPVRRLDFVEKGKNVELFAGVDTWFKRMNEVGEKLGLEIEHYIISSGLTEIIEGTSIYNEFKKIYACEFHYDENGVADWPALTVNYTNKTQFLFRINKGVLEMNEDEQLNEYLEDRNRRIPFRNMIYIGDGLTDVPCMKLVKTNGGQSIAVYQQKEKVVDLLQHRRVDFISPADYTEGSHMEQLCTTILEKMSLVNKLVDLNHQQRDEEV